PSISFDPPDGKLYVGSKDVITCVLTGTQTPQGTFTLTAKPDDKLLLSLDNTHAQIKPPAGSDVYNKAGETQVTCSWQGTSSGSAQGTLQVTVSAPSVSFDPPDGKLYVGSKDVIKCVLTGTQTPEGTFTLTAQPDDKLLLSLDNTHAQIKPPAGSDVYKKTGETQVTCRWQGTSDGPVEGTLKVTVL
ncbi:hypothetical protein X801_07036, partial [Opisthorchis viverrini]